MNTFIEEQLDANPSKVAIIDHVSGQTHIIDKDLYENNRRYYHRAYAVYSSEGQIVERQVQEEVVKYEIIK